MKKFLFSVVLATTLIFGSCTEGLDHSDIWDTLDEYGEAIKDHEQRISTLEELCKQMNTNIDALQAIVEALQQNDYVTNVSEIYSGGEVIGYTITFAKSGSVTIYHGQDGKDGANGADGNDGKDGIDGKDGKDGYTPQIGVKQDTDGIYYWTLDGEWLLDESGNKIKAVGTDGKDGQNGADGSNGNDGQNGADGKDSITPQLKIEDDYWYISYDNGATWTKLGKATGEDGKDGQDGANGSDGDSFFQSVTQNEECVYLTLAEGTIITLPKHKAEAANRKIYYTTSDGKKLFPNTTEPAIFGAILVSNVYEDGQGILTFDDTITSIGNQAFYGCTSLTSVTIGNGVTSIGEEAFRGCTSLTSVTIPDSVTEIEYRAFSGCTSLTSVTIGNSVTSIGTDAFGGCTSLKDVYVNITDLAAYATKNPMSAIGGNKHLLVNGVEITELVIPDSVTSIGDGAFRGCTSLTSVTIPDSVTSIGRCAFQTCHALTSVTIPDSVTSIGGYAFSDCTSLTRVDITDLSAWCKISFGYDEANPLYHGAKLYLNGSELTDITIPSDITEIKAYAFRGCTSLTNVTIGKRVTSIGDDAFRGCTSLTSVTIPDSVTSIEGYAFYNCKSLKDVYVNITDLAAYATKNPMSAIGSNKHLLVNGVEITELVIPDSVTAIGERAFQTCHALTSVTIPDSVTSIGWGAFEDCISLKEVYCKPTTPPTGGRDMFDYNASGRKIYVPAASILAYVTAQYWNDYAYYIEGYEF